MSVLLVFFDGVGIAPSDSDKNPIADFVNVPFPVIGVPYDFYNGILVPTDACLGISGLPQSATGQTTILTGKNAPQIQRRHVNAFPTSNLRKVIAEHSLLKQVKELGLSPTFANAYHPGYFARRHSRFSVSTWSWLAASIDYHNLYDLSRGKAVSHDLTNRFLNRFGFGMPVRRPSQSGEILASLVEEFDFVLFEYIMTDVVGHRKDMLAAKSWLGHIREMMTSLLASIDTKRHTVILVSDHGNLEDLSTNTHTLNRVPTILWGRRAIEMSEQVRDLTDIAPIVKRLLGNN